MNIKKKIITFVLTLAMVLSLVATLNIHATIITDFKIISDTKVTVRQVRKRAKSEGVTETFIDLEDLHYEYSSDCGYINPPIAYVQAVKETGLGDLLEFWMKVVRIHVA